MEHSLGACSKAWQAVDTPCVTDAACRVQMHDAYGLRASESAVQRRMLGSWEAGAPRWPIVEEQARMSKSHGRQTQCHWNSGGQNGRQAVLVDCDGRTMQLTAEYDALGRVQRQVEVPSSEDACRTCLSACEWSLGCRS